MYISQWCARRPPQYDTNDDGFISPEEFRRLCAENQVRWGGVVAALAGLWQHGLQDAGPDLFCWQQGARSCHLDTQDTAVLGVTLCCVAGSQHAWQAHNSCMLAGCVPTCLHRPASPSGGLVGRGGAGGVRRAGHRWGVGWANHAFFWCLKRPAWVHAVQRTPPRGTNW